MLSNLLIPSLARKQYAEAWIIGAIWPKKVFYGMRFEIKMYLVLKCIALKSRVINVIHMDLREPRYVFDELLRKANFDGWQWWWWHRYVGDFMMVTDLRCWWQNHYVGDFFRCVGDFLNVLTRSPTSWISHQHLKLVTNTFGLEHPSPTSM